MDVIPCWLVLIDHACPVPVAAAEFLAVGYQVGFLHRPEVDVVFQYDRVLGAVVDEVMRRPLFPSVEDRLVPPLVVLAAKDKGILFPDQALRQLQTSVHECLPENMPRAFRMEHINGGAGPHEFIGALIRRK